MTLRARGALAAILLLFIATAMLFVSRPGIEADEALVANPALYYWHHIPLMLMSYMGALKAWFYLALFSSPDPIRFPSAADHPFRRGRDPAVLSAARPHRWAPRGVDRRPSSGHRFHVRDSRSHRLRPERPAFRAEAWRDDTGGPLSSEGSAWLLASGFFLLGLGLWDKAIFAWPLIGISLADDSRFSTRYLAARHDSQSRESPRRPPSWRLPADPLQHPPAVRYV